jgi:signal transduction histidine kinase
MDPQSTAAFSLLPGLNSAIAAKPRNHDERLLGHASAEVTGDVAGLEQAFGHLLQNAVDASPESQPVTVRVTSQGEQVSIEIADRGCGMDAEFIRTRLFQPFASTKANGFGIGAYEARALITGMGGRLSVESRPRDGTRFTIQLPLASPVEQKKSA